MKRILRAGKLSAIYEEGSLRYIYASENELLRMIYPAVRDRNWLTLKPEITDEKTEINESSFKISLRCTYRSGNMVFRADYTYEGTEDNKIYLTMEGEAVTQFERNRIGFCVLHPIEGCAGNTCVIEHTDGTTEQSLFPEEISPHQIFRDIKSMKWINKSVTCFLEFEGDIFETEDQRNWTDASYKTYSTPLSLPFPVTLEKGTRVHQKITFKALNVPEPVVQVDETVLIQLLPDESFIMPFIGIGRSSSDKPLTLKEIKILRSAGFDHYRTDIHLYSRSWSAEADLSNNESIELGWPLEIALFFSDNITYQAEMFAEWVETRKPDIERILLFHRDTPSTPDDLASEFIKIIRKENPNLKIATGTNANFAQLNRFRPGDTGNDCLCFSIHPQEHASDNATLVENLRGQEYAVKGVKSFAGRKNIIISPVTLKRRFNPNNSFIELPWEGEGVPPQIDARQMTLFGASWTAGSLKYLCESDVDSITYFETTGERGVIQGEIEPRWPGFFPSEKGMIFPVFHLFRFVMMHKNYRTIKNISSNPLSVDCLSIADDKEARFVIVNFTENEQKVKINGLSGMFRLIPLCRKNLKKAQKDYRWDGLEVAKSYHSSEIFILEPDSINFLQGWLK